ncbi:MAG: hypothetical protein K2Y18_05220 [Alphaproteobacteria bacterium]|nr:hypothetical protein [Alphaproteobacteria bacterium]
MNKTQAILLSCLLSTSSEVLAGLGSVSKSATVSGPLDVKTLTPGYIRPEEEVKSINAYKKLLELKANPEAAHDALAEENLTQRESKLMETIELQHNEDERIKANLKTIEDGMPGIFGKALNAVTFGYSATGVPADSKEDLTKIKGAIADIKANITKQEAELEEVSKDLNMMSSEKEKLATALPTLVKSDVAEARTKAFKTKETQLKGADPMRERLKAIKLGDTSDTAAMAILAERFLIKLDALDKLYHTLSKKIAKFRAIIADDQAILKLMKEDPDLKQGAAGWGSKIIDKIVIVVAYKKEAHKTQTEANDESYKLRRGLEDIRKVLNDEVKQYGEVIKSFEEYTLALPVKINEFKKSKITFFKTHYVTLSIAISVANKNIVEKLVASLNKETELKKTGSKPNDSLLKEIHSLRNQSASYDRQRHYLDTVSEMTPASPKELEEAHKRSQEALAAKEEVSTPQKEKNVDELLEALVSLTAIAKGGSEDILNPLIEKYCKGFFGAAVLTTLAKSNAPALLDQLTGLFLSKLADSMDEGAKLNKNSPQLRLLTVIQKINEIDGRLASINEKMGGPALNEKSLTMSKKELVKEGKMLKDVTDCMSQTLEGAVRKKSCEKAISGITKKASAKPSELTEDDKALIAYKQELEREFAAVQKAVASKIPSKATNKVQRSQEAQSAIMEAMVSILDDSTKVSNELALKALTPLTEMDDDYRDFIKGAPAKVAKRAIPIINGLLVRAIKSGLHGAETDPTKLKYDNKRIPELLIARITEPEGSPEYVKLSNEINQAYKDVMAVREEYKKKLMDVGKQERRQKGMLGKVGLGAETEASKRQHKLSIDEARKAASNLVQESEKYKAGIKSQSGSGQSHP